MNSISVSKRTFMAILASSILSAPVFSQSVTIPKNGGTLTPPQAHELAKAGKITFIDIRRPDEWSKTGSPDGAHRLDLRRKDFITSIDTLVSGERSAPIALICARGVRSIQTSLHLRHAGFTNIIDVPEGMLGSKAGPGWLARDLPLVRG